MNSRFVGIFSASSIFFSAGLLGQVHRAVFFFARARQLLPLFGVRVDDRRIVGERDMRFLDLVQRVDDAFCRISRKAIMST